MTGQAPVTVIIPTYNCRRWVGEAIDSALHQTIPPAQVIVVDDGSTDDTASLLAEYGTKIQAISQANQGVAAARNRGLAAAGSEWVAFLDADDIWHPRKLELQLRTIKANTGIGLLGTGLFVWPAAAVPDLAGGTAPQPTLIGRERLAVKNCLAASSVLIRRDVAANIGQFDTTLSGPEDHDYWLRAAEVAQSGVLPLELTGYRSVAGSLSRRAESMEAGMKQILRKLDARDFWRGDRLLRRRAYSYASYSSAYMHGACGQYTRAIRNLLESIRWYPLPHRLRPDDVPFGRSRRLGVLMMRMLHLMTPDPSSGAIADRA
jgi:glycosyltransferase involved in cell wall biosynthesis